MKEVVVAVDPGREKCGIAVVHKDKGVLYKAIVDTAELAQTVRAAVQDYAAGVVALGAGTSSKKAGAMISAVNKTTRIALVDEYRTTEAARRRYWQENPPGGLKRFIPVSMLAPPVPVDDYAAVIIAEKYLSQRQAAANIL